MADVRKVLKIFLASPGDLTDERRGAKAAVDEINGMFANAVGYHVELVGWEDTISAFGRPQAIINAELDQCEFFVGLMWKRWGTSPDNSGPYTSGFEEEFERSIERRKREGRPEISIFFKDVGAEFLGDPGDDLKKVIAFKKRLIDSKAVYYEMFLDIHELEKKIRRCISHYVLKLRAAEVTQAANLNQAQPTDGKVQPSLQEAGATPDTPFSKEGLQFLRDFISKVEVNSEEDVIQPAEVARFRLLSDIARRQQNDPRLLDVHDANLLFAARDDFVFGDAKLMGLIGAGLENYSQECVPFWHWYAAADGAARELLPMYSVAGPTEGRRAGALSAMQLISEPLPSRPRFERKFCVDRWLAQDEDPNVKVAALSYLGEVGVPEDISAIKQELAQNNYQTKSAGVEAIIRINLRESREKGIASLYELQPATVGRNLLNAALGQSSSLNSETLLAGITQQSSEIRPLVVRLLRARHALPVETAERLLTDDSAPVRLEALRSLAEAGRTFSDAECRNILVKRSANRGLGAFQSGYDAPGQACLEQLQEERLRTLDDKILEDKVKEESVYDQKGRFILAERHFAKYAPLLRKAIEDRFVSDFSDAVEKMKARFGTDVVNIDQSLDEFLRNKLTYAALDVICRKSNAQDLPLVRKAIVTGSVDYSPTYIAYLNKFGEWEDIPTIIAAANLLDAREYTLLSLGERDGKYREAARSIYKIGRERFREVLAIAGIEQTLPYIIAKASDVVYRSLSDGSIMGLLHSDSHTVRKAASLKCIRALPKERLGKILNYYMSEVKHYYNVSHWFDFGLSGPREKALRAAKRIMKREWLE
jgi:hypothetical protein